MSKSLPQDFDPPSSEVAELRARLQEAEEVLEAIRSGHVDAVVVSGTQGDKVFTLEGAEHAYRMMIEAMGEGAIITSLEGNIRYCNRSFAEMVGQPVDRILGRSILPFFDKPSIPTIEKLLSGADGRRREARLRNLGSGAVQAQITARRLDVPGPDETVYFVVTDVSEQRETESQLHETQIKYRSIFENASEGIFQITPEGRFIGANPAISRIYGYADPETLLEALNRNPNALYAEPERHRELRETLRSQGYVFAFDSQVVRADGTSIWISENIHAVHNAAGSLEFFEGNAVDITARRLYEDQLERHANYDPLTGLANRRLLRERLDKAIQTAGIAGTEIAVVYIDLDNFKLINDGLGHTLGDRLLVAAGERLKECVRNGDTVARQGGDEFVLILDRSDLASVPQLVLRLLKTVAEPVLIDEHEINVTCSIGFSVFPADGDDADTLLKHADAAMYRAKEQGRNNVQAFTEDLNRDITRKLSLESALRRAIKRDELMLCYQPQIVVATDRVAGAEALLRWGYGQPDERLPSEFVPVAEETGLIVPIGEWALHAACSQCRGWQLSHDPAVRVSVNLSPRQFRERGLVGMVARVLAETGLAAECLDLELTENLVMHNVDSAIATMSELSEMGVNISIDDFGVGHSSLSYLKRFPIDILKIDRSFVQDIEAETDRSAAIARTIINLGHSRVFAWSPKASKPFPSSTTCAGTAATNTRDSSSARRYPRRPSRSGSLGDPRRW